MKIRKSPNTDAQSLCSKFATQFIRALTRFTVLGVCLLTCAWFMCASVDCAAYGLTETSGIVTMTPFSVPTNQQRRSRNEIALPPPAGSCGMLISNTEAKVSSIFTPINHTILSICSDAENQSHHARMRPCWRLPCLLLGLSVYLLAPPVGYSHAVSHRLCIRSTDHTWPEDL